MEPSLLHADHNENAFALRHQIRNDIAALPNASIYGCTGGAPTANPATWYPRSHS
jgi:hypothetical protein